MSAYPPVPIPSDTSLSRCPALLRLVLFVSICLGSMSLVFLGIVPDVLPFRAGVLCCLAAGVIAASVCSRNGAAIVSLIVVSWVCSVWAADLVWRRIAWSTIYRPEEMFLNRWPRMRALARYSPGATFSARSYGDLAAMAARPDLREYRTIRFSADRFGFPNPHLPQEPIDLILLGDSFGAGSGSTQEKTWGELLRSEYGFMVYNLSIPESGPWHELVNLKAELPRLNRAPGCTVVWAIFAGNDLDDEYQDSLEVVLDDSRLSQMAVSFASFRNRSPIHQLCTRGYVVLRRGRRPPLQRPLPDGRVILFRQGYVDSMQRSLVDIQSHRNHPQMDRVFAEMSRFVSRQGLGITVMLLPSKEQVYRWILEERPYSPRDAGPSDLSFAIRTLCERYRLPFVDLQPLMSAQADHLWKERGDLLWWRDDTHWNELGHAFVAEAVSRMALRRRPSGLGAE